MALKNGKNTTIEDGPRGQKLVSSTGRDNSSYKGGGGRESFRGRPMGGGCDNISHSIKGATANQTGRMGNDHDADD